MFFILKDEKTIIAADDAFMEQAGVESIYLLAELFRVGEFPLNEADQTCRIDGKNERYAKTRVQTLSGEAFLYDFSEASAAEDDTTSEETALAHPEADEHLAVPEEMSVPHSGEKEAAAADEEAPELPEEPEPIEPIPAETAEPAPQTDEPVIEDEILTLKEEEPSEPEPAEIEQDENRPDDTRLSEASLGAAAAAGAAILLPREEEEEEEEEVSKGAEGASAENEEHFELLELDEEEPPKAFDEAAEALMPETDQAPPFEPEAETEETPPLPLAEAAPGETPYTVGTTEETPAQAPFADYDQNAQLIGISSEEYAGFLSQFVEEAREHEANLRGNDLRAFRENIVSLKDASQLLHLPKLTDKLRETEAATSEEKGTLLDEFYTMILHIQDDIRRHGTLPTEAEPPETEAPAEDEPAPAEPASVDTEHILDHVTPLPFDFSARVAADELGLPEPLVEEFVVDFIKQAKEHIPVFERAQADNDLETVQKKAHLLKGAAGNLRIDPLAETLEALQLNEDVRKIPELFQRFVGQLKALDNFIHTPGL